ncbi:N/A [soil metagenome]
MEKPPVILIVEDDPALSNLYDKFFKSDGFVTLIARDGAVGLERATKEKPDIILLDMNLPLLNGLEVFEKLVADPITKKIPVVFLTNVAEDEARKRALDLGAKDYLAKAQFAPEEIVLKVKKYIGLLN